jgi:ribose 5-phosphate isomerase B
MTDEILIAADHAGYELKEKLESQLQKMGYNVRDLGTNSLDSTDYPDYAHPLAKAVSTGRAKRGVLVCGTGLGMSYVANRYPNVRAAVTWSPEIAQLARSHNDANVLVLPSRFVTDDQAAEILKRWLETPFDGGRHERRVVKIESEEQDLKADVNAGMNGDAKRARGKPKARNSKAGKTKAKKRTATKAKKKK